MSGTVDLSDAGGRLLDGMTMQCFAQRLKPYLHGILALSASARYERR
jgi:hypothetical protein